MKSLKLSQVIFGYKIAIQARRLSPDTLRDYQRTMRKILEHLNEDPEFDAITADDIRGFLAGLDGISKKTLLNYHVGLSALWSWAVGEGFAVENIVRRVERPTPEKPAIEPLSQEDVKAMLGVIASSRSYARPGKRESSHSLPDAERNRAIILLLLDTGIRSSELCNLKLGQLDLQNQRIKVMGKGSKERSVPFSARTGKALWRYISARPDDSAGSLVFVTRQGESLDRDRLYHLINAIGERAGVQNARPHRFRHTFAINYLRNGGDPYSLQMMLGHSTMEMVRRYLALAQADLDNMHKIASPVSNWRL